MTLGNSCSSNTSWCCCLQPPGFHSVTLLQAFLCTCQSRRASGGRPLQEARQAGSASTSCCPASRSHESSHVRSPLDCEPPGSLRNALMKQLALGRCMFSGDSSHATKRPPQGPGEQAGSDFHRGHSVSLASSPRPHPSSGNGLPFPSSPPPSLPLAPSTLQYLPSPKLTPLCSGFFPASRDLLVILGCHPVSSTPLTQRAFPFCPKK